MHPLTLLLVSLPSILAATTSNLTPSDVPISCIDICGPIVELSSVCQVPVDSASSELRRRERRVEDARRAAEAYITARATLARAAYYRRAAVGNETARATGTGFVLSDGVKASGTGSSSTTKTSKSSTSTSTSRSSTSTSKTKTSKSSSSSSSSSSRTKTSKTSSSSTTTTTSRPSGTAPFTTATSTAPFQNSTSSTTTFFFSNTSSTVLTNSTTTQNVSTSTSTLFTEATTTTSYSSTTSTVLPTIIDSTAPGNVGNAILPSSTSTSESAASTNVSQLGQLSATDIKRVQAAEKDCVCENTSFNVARIAALCASCISIAGFPNGPADMIVSNCNYTAQTWTSEEDSLANNIVVKAVTPQVTGVNSASSGAPSLGLLVLSFLTFAILP